MADAPDLGSGVYDVQVQVLLSAVKGSESGEGFCSFCFSVVDLEETMDYVLHYDMAALVLVVIVLIHFYHKKGIRLPQTYVFMGLAWGLLATDILDVITVLIGMWRVPVPVAYVVNVVYLVLFNILPVLAYLYLLIAVGSDWRGWSKAQRVLIFLPISVSALMIVTSPLTKLIFYYNLEEGYQHGRGFGLLYVAVAVYMVASLMLTYLYKTHFSGWQKTSTYFYLAAAFAGVVIQFIFPNILILQFALTLSLLLLYMSLENPDDDEEKFFGIYNRSGFDKMISASVGKQDAFHVVVVTITNFYSIREAMGVEFSRVLAKQVVESLKISLKPVELFYLGENKLAIIVDEKRGDLNRSISALREGLNHPMIAGSMNLQLETVIFQIDYPSDVTTVEDIMDSIDYAEAFPYENNDGEVLRVGGEILEGRRRESRILQIMQRALANGTFQVYYQPIYSNEEGRYNSAEALLRLYDSEMGFISPEEFIPMAEKNGMILKIGEFVFRTVCCMMARERIWERGIDYIEVNLSVVQCMQEDICEMLYGIMDEYAIPYSCINLEVTETTLARDILWDTMERMSVGGVTFSLDDYGTGYSNLSNVLKYPFNIVKLDKSMVWYAMENEPAMRALRHTVAMIRDLEMHIVAEGVETEEQRRILTEMGCEYLQGYYFSKPVPEKNFLTTLMK